MRFLSLAFALVLLAAPFAVAVQPAHAAYTFSDDFESGDISAWSDSLTEAGTTVEVIAGAAKNGSFGLHVTGDGTNDDAKVAEDNSGSGHTLTYIRTNFRVVDVPGGSADEHLIITSDDSTGALDCSGGLDDASDLEYMMFDCIGFVKGLDAFSEDTWYCVELVFDSASGSDMWVDGTNVRTSSNTFASTELAYLQLGHDGPGQSFNYYFDDYYSDSSTTTTNGGSCDPDSGGAPGRHVWQSIITAVRKEQA